MVLTTVLQERLWKAHSKNASRRDSTENNFASNFEPKPENDGNIASGTTNSVANESIQNNQLRSGSSMKDINYNEGLRSTFFLSQTQLQNATFATKSLCLDTGTRIHGKNNDVADNLVNSYGENSVKDQESALEISIKTTEIIMSLNNVFLSWGFLKTTEDFDAMISALKSFIESKLNSVALKVPNETFSPIDEISTRHNINSFLCLSRSDTSTIGESLRKDESLGFGVPLGMLLSIVSSCIPAYVSTVGAKSLCESLISSASGEDGLVVSALLVQRTFLQVISKLERFFTGDSRILLAPHSYVHDDVVNLLSICINTAAYLDYMARLSVWEIGDAGIGMLIL